MTSNLTTAPTKLTDGPSLRMRLLGAIAAGTLVVSACGGGSDSTSTGDPGAVSDAPTADDDSDFSDLGDAGLDDLDLDTDGLDEGQLEILDDVVDGLNDEFSDDDGEASAAWSGIRLIDGSTVRTATLDPDAFGAATDGFRTDIADRNSTESNNRTIATNVVVDETAWVSAKYTVSAVSLSDGSVTNEISIEEVLPGGEFGEITGDSDGLYVLATVRGGSDLVVEIDPSTGAVASTIDLSDATTSLFTLASNSTHVAAAYESAPGIPVKLIDRATGAVTDIGNYLKLHRVEFVRDELWVIISSSSVSEPAIYEKYSVDGSLIGEGQLPRVGTFHVIADRAVVTEHSNAAKPDAPVMPVEVEPVGTPIETFLPEGMVLLTAYAEIDGYAISSGRCCVRTEFDARADAAVVDMSTGEVVQLIESFSATDILPAAAS